MVDMTDVARLHVVAAIDSTINHERIFAFGSPFNWNDLVDAVQKAKPSAVLQPHDPSAGRDLSEPDNELGRTLLKKWWNQPDYTSLEESIRQNLEGLA